MPQNSLNGISPIFVCLLWGHELTKIWNSSLIDTSGHGMSFQQLRLKSCKTNLFKFGLHDMAYMAELWDSNYEIIELLQWLNKCVIGLTPWLNKGLSWLCKAGNLIAAASFLLLVWRHNLLLAAVSFYITYSLLVFHSLKEILKINYWYI